MDARDSLQMISKDAIHELVDQVGDDRLDQLHRVVQDFTNVGDSETDNSLQAIEGAIESSRDLIDIEDDWDGEGSPGYLEQTWRRAAQFVREYAAHLAADYGLKIPAPGILPGPDGSIDIHWESDSFELLVNIPADANERAEFYGDDHGSIYIKGNLDPSRVNQGLIEWLQKAS